MIIDINTTFISGSSQIGGFGIGRIAKGASRKTTDDAGLPTTSRGHRPHLCGAAQEQEPCPWTPGSHEERGGAEPICLIIVPK